MKKLVLVTVLLLSYGCAETWGTMPPDSPQYKVAQQVIAAVYGFEEPCPEIASEAEAREKEIYKVSQTVCGGYFIMDKPPLEEIDKALSGHTSNNAWYRLLEGNYRKTYSFRSGELLVSFNERRDFDNEANLYISYNERRR